MALTPDIQYLRVRHLGKEEGSLYLADLDTEQNKKEPYKIPVYIQEGSSVDLPLNDQVLLSFNQGTLRSFIDQGFIAGHVVSDNGEAEVWVSQDGSDDNPGTRNAPFASIQYAIDTLVEKVGHDEQKLINLFGGGFPAQPIINWTKNLIISGQGDGIEGQREWQANTSSSSTFIEPSDINYVVTNMTKESYLEWENEGGFDYTIDADSYTYTGADLTNREIAYPPATQDDDFYGSNSVFENISFMGGIGDILVICASPDESTTAVLSNVRIENVFYFGDVLVKNARSLQFFDFTSNSINGSVLDGVLNVIAGRNREAGTILLAEGGLIIDTSVRDCDLHLVSSIDPDISIFGAGGLSIYGREVLGNLTLYGGASINFSQVNVLGNVTIDAAAGNITWRGGSFYGTLTDPDTRMGDPAPLAGDYLNVTPA